MKLYGLTEFAQALGWDRRKLATYIARGVVPKPYQHLAAGPVWTEAQVLSYVHGRNMPRGPNDAMDVAVVVAPPVDMSEGTDFMEILSGQELLDGVLAVGRSYDVDLPAVLVVSGKPVLPGDLPTGTRVLFRSDADPVQSGDVEPMIPRPVVRRLVDAARSGYDVRIV